MKSEAWLVRRLERSFLVGGVALLIACGKGSVGSGGNCCTDHEWTTSAEFARAYAAKDATDTGGCPSKIDRGEKPPTDLPPDAGEPPYSGMVLLDSKTKALRANNDTSCVYHVMTCCPGGRPLYAANETRPVVATRTRGGRWSKAKTASTPLGTTLAPAARAAIAHGWLEDAFAEHASVASFARATLELVAVGAPPSLLAAHQRAGIQEVRHAERCFALARAYGGDAIDPGPLAITLPRAGGLERLACDLLVEGCVAETIGALMATRALEECTVEPARDALRVIAADEAAHAALAWRTLAWALEEGGDAVATAVLERADAARPPADVRGADDGFRSHGRLSTADMARATQDAWRLVIDPLLARLRAAASRPGASARDRDESGCRAPGRRMA